MARTECDSYFLEIQNTAHTQGWQTQRTAKGHWRFTPPVKAYAQVIFSGSPGDHRAIKNFISKLRQSGLVLKR